VVQFGKMNCWKKKMSKATDIQTKKPSGDLVLQEIWRIKDTLSASYDMTWTASLPKPANAKDIPAIRS
jgi:hypothetical protein